jgi:N-acetyl-gamma-glutamyl-phosphate reductase
MNLLPKGVQPRTADTVGTNNANFGIEVDERSGRVVVTCAIDNLGKGTAGAAIQSVNIALGIPEATGLSTIGVAP